MTKVGMNWLEVYYAPIIKSLFFAWSVYDRAWSALNLALIWALLRQQMRALLR